MNNYSLVPRYPQLPEYVPLSGRGRRCHLHRLLYHLPKEWKVTVKRMIDSRRLFVNRFPVRLIAPPIVSPSKEPRTFKNLLPNMFALSTYMHLKQRYSLHEEIHVP